MADRPDQLALHRVKQVVHHVVPLDDPFGLDPVPLGEGLQALDEHHARLRRHLPNHLAVERRQLFQHQLDFGDIRRVVADALHVRRHLQRRGDHAQVARHRLLRQEQAVALLLDLPVLLVDFLVVGDDRTRPVVVVLQQRRHRPADGHADHLAHFKQRPVQLLQLHIVIFSARHAFFLLSQTGR